MLKIMDVIHRSEICVSKLWVTMRRLGYAWMYMYRNAGLQVYAPQARD